MDPNGQRGCQRVMGPGTRRRRSISFATLVFGGFAVCILATALAAYNVGPIPISWIGDAGLFALGLLVFSRVRPAPGTGWLIAYIVWSAVVTIATASVSDYGSLMPPLATTPYPVFVALRFLEILSFAGTVQVVYWLLSRGHEAAVSRYLVVLGFIVSLAAAYIYLAQVFGLPEPPRNRMGTRGGEQATVFTYAFHRAMGTFREPSHLAEWLIVPLFLGVRGIQERSFKLYTAAIASILLLTGSLTGILSALFGIGLATVLMGPIRKSTIKLILTTSLVVLFGLAVFDRVAVRYADDSTGLVDVVVSRVAPIVSGGGVLETNRAYVYEYVSDEPPPLLGKGVGHANLAFSQYLGWPVVSSFLNLYLNILYSSGIFGLGLMAVFLLVPLFRAGVSRAFRERPDAPVLVGQYFAWLIVFAVHSEVLTPMFAIAHAMLVYSYGSSTYASVGQPVEQARIATVP